MTIQNNQTVIRYNIDTSRWMKTIIPVNADGMKYYEDARLTSIQHEGKVIPIENTLIIFKQGVPAAPREFFCEIHRMVYPINGTCPGCQNELSDEATATSVTKV